MAPAHSASTVQSRGCTEQRLVTCEVLQVLLPQQVLSLVMQGTEELPAGPTVQVIILIPLWTETVSGEQGGGGIPPSLNIKLA